MLFAMMDSDGDGTVSLQEFQAAHERIFKAMDANKDGRLTLEEIQAFMQGTRRAVPQQFGSSAVRMKVPRRLGFRAPPGSSTMKFSPSPWITRPSRPSEPQEPIGAQEPWLSRRAQRRELASLTQFSNFFSSKKAT
jgi:EF hand